MGSGRNSSASTMEKSAVLNPMPTARDRIATVANPGLRSSHFSAYRTSASMPPDTLGLGRLFDFGQESPRTEIRRPRSVFPIHYFRTSDLGLRTSDFGLRTSDFGPRTSDLGFRTS